MQRKSKTQTRVLGRCKGSETRGTTKMSEKARTSSRRTRHEPPGRRTTRAEGREEACEVRSEDVRPEEEVLSVLNEDECVVLRLLCGKGSDLTCADLSNVAARVLGVCKEQL